MSEDTVIRTPDEHATRDLTWDACYNARDLGGYPTTDGRATRRQALIRADNLVRLTPAGQAALRAYGVRTILDLRLAYELASDPSPFAATSGQPGEPRYVHLPLHDAATDAAIDAADSTAAGYLVLLEQNHAHVAAVIGAVAAGLAAGGVVVHCHGGKDRTGLVAALLLALVGVPPALIAADYAHSAVQLEGPYAAWLTAQTAAQGHPVTRPALDGVAAGDYAGRAGLPGPPVRQRGRLSTGDRSAAGDPRPNPRTFSHAGRRGAALNNTMRSSGADRREAHGRLVLLKLGVPDHTALTNRPTQDRHDAGPAT